MDPQANLQEQRELASQIGCNLENALTAETAHKAQLHKEVLESAERLAQLVEDLDEWIMNVGFLPADWQASRKAPDAG